MRFSNPVERELYYRSQIDYCYWLIENYNNQCLSHPSKKETIEDVIDSIKVIIRCKNKINEKMSCSVLELKDVNTNCQNIKRREDNFIGRHLL